MKALPSVLLFPRCVHRLAAHCSPHFGSHRTPARCSALEQRQREAMIYVCGGPSKTHG